MANKAYFIQETVRDENGEYIPCIAVDGESGYYLTDWHWSTDRALAEQCCDEKNEAMGITTHDAMLIVLRSMFSGVRNEQ